MTPLAGTGDKDHMTAHSEITGFLTPEDVARAKRIVNQRPTVRGIVQEVSALTGLTPETIIGRSRERTPSAARRLVWFIAHQRGISLSHIARATGHHISTVSDGIRKEALTREAQA